MLHSKYFTNDDETTFNESEVGFSNADLEIATKVLFGLCSREKKIIVAHKCF